MAAEDPESECLVGIWVLSSAGFLFFLPRSPSGALLPRFGGRFPY